jgi:hypothetical protein
MHPQNEKPGPTPMQEDVRAAIRKAYPAKTWGHRQSNGLKAVKAERENPCLGLERRIDDLVAASVARRKADPAKYNEAEQYNAIMGIVWTISRHVRAKYHAAHGCPVVDTDLARVFAEESRVEGEANAAQVELLVQQDSPGALKRAWDWLTRHEDRIGRARLGVEHRMAIVEGNTAVARQRLGVTPRSA